MWCSRLAPSSAFNPGFAENLPGAIRQIVLQFANTGGPEFAICRRLSQMGLTKMILPEYRLCGRVFGVNRGQYKALGNSTQAAIGGQAVEHHIRESEQFRRDLT